MRSIRRVEQAQLKRVPEFSAGDTIRVYVQVAEGEKVRAQVFQGVVLGRRGGGLRASFTVRKISGGVAVERVFPLHSPSIAKIEKIREGKVRRAKLTYLRGRKGKSARIAGRDVSESEKRAAAEALQAPKEVPAAPVVDETPAVEVKEPAAATE